VPPPSLTNAPILCRPLVIERRNGSLPSRYAEPICFLVNPTNANAEAGTREALSAAAGLAVQVVVVRATNETTIDSAATTAVQLGARAVLIGPDALLAVRGDQIIALAARNSLATIFSTRAFAMAGGSDELRDQPKGGLRQVGVYAGDIINGAKPADLPVHQSTNVELVINLKTAKALGLTAPATLLARADEVI
jgi:putative ABC transport system substrate-binding protein